MLGEVAHQEGLGRGAFDFLPTLKFYASRESHGGEVERASLKALPALSRGRRRELAEIVGRSLALFSWLGVADLHWENLVLGADARGRIVFGPPRRGDDPRRPVVCPPRRSCLPDADPEYAVICQHACGVRRVLPYLGKPIAVEDLLAMIGGYRRALALLERHASAIAGVFADLPELDEAPIRVCLRGTGDYVRAGVEPLWPPLLDAEAEQLARGDIPYFYRLYGRRGIHYYGDEALTERKTLPQRATCPKLAPLLSVPRGLRAPSRKKLREEGPFTVLGAFDHPSFSGTHSNGELEVTFGGRALVVGFPDGKSCIRGET